MSWNTIIGHKQQIKVLQKALETGRLAHAYLFTGPEACGKESVAFELARILNCRTADPVSGSCETCKECISLNAFMHPNVEYIFPVESALLDPGDTAKKENKRFTEAKERYDLLLEEKKQNPFFSPAMERSMGILTEQVIALQHKASFMPSQGTRKIFILSQAEKLHPSAANKLLKLLEEPPAHILFILVSSRPEAVLPTIRSRCQVIRFSRVSSRELRLWLHENRPEITDPLLSFIVSFSRGNLRLAWEFINNIGSDTAETATIILRNQAIDYLRKALVPGKLHEAITASEEQVKNLSRTELTLFIGALLLFFQDVNHRRINPSFQGLNNPDIVDSIDRFAKNFPDPDFFRISTIAEEAIRAIERNANPTLVMAAFTAELKGLLQRVT
ncbi:DNA polymerase III subunit [Chlorobium phaeobacteroides]|jgi:DNA polymerase-3 subunit delta'|uniref:DNA-directed DNA polymerase n=1 Tax=Chlorobium phaeobacteroides (strain DSM 266 / SMG 266 / 2430) TaxID=290317 RepID=A1BE16_CHLPD|nr:DNA polymerase III subunit delta' [Chlorobium phaeobacteroides]ABL64643.1 DNA-directed DNA polymerase [Chlorobium phaeobacteroides DSM 266]MBV5326301.1 DNA polymerase III subunit delta' [Chlorobium sp.]